jgi:hypothetical protein
MNKRICAAGWGMAVAFMFAVPDAAGEPVQTVPLRDVAHNRGTCSEYRFGTGKVPCESITPCGLVFEGRPDARRQPFYYQGSGQGHKRGPLYSEPRP